MTGPDNEQHLMLAIANGHTETVTMLLNHGTDINVADHRGVTPLMIAAQKGHAETVIRLLNHHANINAATLNGFTPLMIAAQKGHTETVILLLTYGAGINAVNQKGFTPLMIGAQNGHTETVTVLINQGADINVVNPKGVTPLMLAAHGGHTETVTVLLTHGADINAANQKGLTPLMLAVHNHHIQTFSCLHDFQPASCLAKALEYEELFFRGGGENVCFEQVARQFNILSVYAESTEYPDGSKLYAQARLALGKFYLRFNPNEAHYLKLAMDVFDSIPENEPETYQEAQSQLAFHILEQPENNLNSLKKALKHAVNAKDPWLSLRAFQRISGNGSLNTADDFSSSIIKEAVAGNIPAMLSIIAEEKKGAAKREQALQDRIKQLEEKQTSDTKADCSSDGNATLGFFSSRLSSSRLGEARQQGILSNTQSGESQGI